MVDREPITIGEIARWLRRHIGDSEKVHADLEKSIEKLDDRTVQMDKAVGKLTTRITVLFAVIGVLWAIFLVLAPFIRAALGIGGG